MSASTKNAVIPPRARFSGSVTANTRAKSAESPPVMKCLRPETIHEPLVLMAFVLIRVASEPAPGSVRAKQVIFSPRMSGSRYFSRCSGVQSR